MVLVATYCFFMLLIFVFSLGQLHLTWHYLKGKRRKPTRRGVNKENPVVTVQLPVYNEKYVVSRLIDAVCRFDYPKDRLEIQVLDDSTDETVDIIAEKVKEWQQKSLNIIHIRRGSREGFKAGALHHGLAISKGEFIAIFDADFLPEPDFLQKTLPGFDAGTGVVQTRWGHINEDFSSLTRLQAFALNAHFFVEQGGRSSAGSFINFNGTGGIWRRACIEDAGGWSTDTLTEDLDLSYRAQMKGWKFRYLEGYEVAAELPVLMTAIKSQQYRWNKGAAETARKNLRKVWQTKVQASVKIHALLHLLNSSVFLCLFAAAVLSVPVLFAKSAQPHVNWLFNLSTIFLAGFFSIAFFYWIAARQAKPHKTSMYYFRVFPAFLVVSMGLSLHNGLAVLEGLWGVKTPFIRTPKFNVTTTGDSWKGNVYVGQKPGLMPFLEGFFALYFSAGITAGILLQQWELLIFHVMLTMGFASVCYYSIKPMKYV